MAHSSINSLHIDGVVNSNHVEISNNLVSHYAKLYSTAFNLDGPTIVCSVIFHLVFEVDNVLLTAVPSALEIKDIVFAIDPNNTHGPDGFSSLFYQHCWHIVSPNVVHFV